MPIQGFSTGKDITLSLITPQGAVLTGGLTGFESRQMTASLDSKLIDGTNKYADPPTGWEGTFDFDRYNSNLDDLFSQIEDAYYNGSDPGVWTITQTIVENNGGTTQYRYEGVSPKLTEAGSYKGDTKVSQRVSFRATRRRKVQ